MSSFTHFLGRAALLLALTAPVAPTTALAQPGNNGSTGGPPGPQSVTEVPLDGGASLLLLGGLGYGLRRLRRRPAARARACPPRSRLPAR